MDVYIAVGHGRRPDGIFDPGARSGVHNEQRDAVPVAEAATQVLRDTGLDVISEVEDADDPNFYGTTARANHASVEALVSFHYDWTGAPPGAFMIATTNAARELGTAIENRVAEAGFDIRDYPDDRDNLYLLNRTVMPAVIFECGRIGHHVIDEPDEQERMGRAAGLGILDWLGIEQGEVMKIPKPSWLPTSILDRLAKQNIVPRDEESEDMWRFLTFLDRHSSWTKRKIAAASAAAGASAAVVIEEIIRRLGS